MIKYKKRRRYKYNLHSTLKFDTGIVLSEDYSSKYIELSSHGTLVINAGYSWDGPSGPTIDTENFMEASLIHDALYQLLREEVIEPKYKDVADRILRKICIDKGMSKFRAWYVYHAVRKFGHSAAKPDLLTAR